MADFSQYIIDYRDTIKNAFKKQDLNHRKFILVVDEKEDVVGIVTDGDFRRAIWNAVLLEDPISTIMNRNFKSLPVTYSLEDVARIFLNNNIMQVPVLREGKLSDIIFRKDYKESELKQPSKMMNLPVVIMAGGKGTRMDPFTRILPKPLIPVGEKAVIEIIMERFAEFGMTHFYLSVSHRAKMVKAYFEEACGRYRISYIDEDIPLGTIGGIKFLESAVDSDFFVTNCDIIVDEDYAEIYKFHKKGDYALTVLGSMQHFVVPYGVLKMRGGAELEEIREKPEYDFLVNTGMYIVSPRVLSFIPKNKKYDMTDLIGELSGKGERIGVYPVSEKSWIDIGQWEAYRKSLKRLAWLDGKGDMIL